MSRDRSKASVSTTEPRSALRSGRTQIRRQTQPQERRVGAGDRATVVGTLRYSRNPSRHALSLLCRPWRHTNYLEPEGGCTAEPPKTAILPVDTARAVVSYPVHAVQDMKLAFSPQRSGTTITEAIAHSLHRLTRRQRRGCGPSHHRQGREDLDDRMKIAASAA